LLIFSNPYPVAKFSATVSNDFKEDPTRGILLKSNSSHLLVVFPLILEPSFNKYGRLYENPVGTP